MFSSTVFLSRNNNNILFRVTGNNDGACSSEQNKMRYVVTMCNFKNRIFHLETLLGKHNPSLKVCRQKRNLVYSRGVGCVCVKCSHQKHPFSPRSCSKHNWKWTRRRITVIDRFRSLWTRLAENTWGKISYSWNALSRITISERKKTLSGKKSERIKLSKTYLISLSIIFRRVVGRTTRYADMIKKKIIITVKIYNDSVYNSRMIRYILSILHPLKSSRPKFETENCFREFFSIRKTFTDPMKKTFV